MTTSMPISKPQLTVGRGATLCEARPQGRRQIRTDRLASKRFCDPLCDSLATAGVVGHTTR